MVRLERTADVSRGDQYSMTCMSTSVHTGTHVDAPAHFLRDGRTVEQLDLEVGIGPARVIDLTHVDNEITARDLAAASLPAGTERVLLKTRNSAFWQQNSFREDYVGVSPDAAQWLVEKSLRLVGIDYMSVERFASTDFATHKILLQAGVYILEGVNLAGIAPGTYHLICLPLKLGGAEGAPARAVLLSE